jgi:hypothetical protein
MLIKLLKTIKCMAYYNPNNLHCLLFLSNQLQYDMFQYLHLLFIIRSETELDRITALQCAFDGVLKSLETVANVLDDDTYWNDKG